MSQSETLAALAKALSGFQAECEGAKKNAVNPHLKNKYADLASIWEAIHEPLAKHGLSVVQLPAAGEKGELRLRTRLLHESGEWLESEIAMPIGKLDPQGYGSALTYARRYALAAMLGVTQEDDDAAAAVKGKVERREHREADAWAPNQAQIKRAYAIGQSAGLTSEEVDKVARKYFQVDGPAHFGSKDDYDEFTRDGGTLQAAGEKKRAHLAQQQPAA
jgi:hypothetical protein